MELIATMNNNCDKVIFYELVINIKRFTILRNQTTNKYFIYCNKTRLIAYLEKFNPNKITEIETNKLEWYISNLFFSTESMLVKNWGFPEYDRLVNIYKKLAEIRANEIDNQRLCDKIIKGNYVLSAKINAIFQLLKIRPKGIIKNRIKRLELIW